MSELSKYPDSKYIDFHYNISSIQKIMFNKVIPLHWHEFYEIELFLGGSGIATMNGKDYNIERGRLFWVTPTDIHSYVLTEKSETVNISFSINSIEDISITERLSMHNGDTILLDDDEIEWILMMSKKIRNELRCGEFLAKKYISQIMGCIIIEILRKIERRKFSDNTPNSIQQAVHYICLHFRENITLENISSYVGLSKNHFCEKFHSSMDITFKEYLTKVRLDYALRLILYTDISINDVSYFSGFNSVSYFLRIFKKKFNISPLAYRKKYKTE